MMKHPLIAAIAALLTSVSIQAVAHEPSQGSTRGGITLQETITPVFKHDLPDAARPNMPGKTMTVVEVSFPPGAASPAHTHPKSAFIYAYVVSGEIVSAVDDEKPRVYKAGESWYEAPGAHHPVTRNPSTTESSKLLVVFIADPSAKQLVFPDAK